MKSKQIRMITHGAILAALYVALTYLQNWLLPGTTSAAIQFRASEALCIFALFTPAAIPGLTVGCLLFNISARRRRCAFLPCSLRQPSPA